MISNVAVKRIAVAFMVNHRLVPNRGRPLLAPAYRNIAWRYRNRLAQAGSVVLVRRYRRRPGISRYYKRCAVDRWFGGVNREGPERQNPVLEAAVEGFGAVRLQRAPPTPIVDTALTIDIRATRARRGCWRDTTMTERNDSAVARASHDAYVRAVVEQLVQRGIEVTDLAIETDEPRRAEMTVSEVDPMNTMWRDSEGQVQLLWDERSGWRWQVRYPGQEQPRGAVRFGVSAVPQPSAVAGWMLISLAHPETAVSREDGPFVTPDLDTVLHAYAVT